VDELAESAFVSAYAVQGIKVRKPAAAQATPAITVKSSFGVERSVALNAEGIGGKGFGERKAGGANRAGRETGQAGATYTAIVRKRKRKNTRGSLCSDVSRRRKPSSRLRYVRFASRLERIYQVAKQSCREDAPP